MKTKTKTKNGKDPQNASLRFLSGGGSMGDLIRNFNWEVTQIGPISEWPSNLRSTLSICLSSNFPIGIYWGKDLVLLYNDAWSPILANKHPWALGRPAIEVWPDIWNDIEPLFKETMTNGTPTGSKDALLPMERHGIVEECYFDFTFTPVYDESGAVAGIFNAAIETTYRVISDRRASFINTLALDLSSCQSEPDVYDNLKELFRRDLIDLPFSFLYTLDKVNGRELKTHSLTDEEFDKLGVVQPFPFDEIDESENSLHLYNLDQYLKNTPVSLWSEPTSEAIIFPLREVDGRISSYVVFGLNSRKRLDNDYYSFLKETANIIGITINNIRSIEVERTKREVLEQIDKAKTIFFSNISHEFRTPLTLILSPLEELLRNSEGNLTQLQKQHIDTTHRNAMRLLKLVNNLLDFSRIESGRQTADFSLEDISAYTKNLAGNFRSMIEKAGVQFNVKTEEFVQPVYIDKGIWEKIVFNLLSNAFKYTLSGSITVHVFSEHQNAVLTVEDTGVGIPQSELPLMFERFHRVQGNDARTHEGTGIGLSLVKELVKIHGGTISVDSKQGVGSRFTVSIPFGKNHLPLDQIVKKKADFDFPIDNLLIAEASGFINNPETVKEEKEVTEAILLVDDNPDMREHIKRLLETTYNVVTAANGMEALHKLKDGNITLVISDIMMPIMDGYQLVKEIKNDERINHIPIVLLSARAGEEAQLEGYDTGADDYLIKPFSSKELLARIAVQLRMVKAKKKVNENLTSVINQSPVAMTMLLGKDKVIKLANVMALELWGKKSEEVIDRSALDAFPELVSQGFGKILDDVYQTGNPFIANEMPVTLLRHGKQETLYINFIYQPLKNSANETHGIVGIGVDVTEQVMSRNRIEESEQRFEAAVKAIQGILWTNSPNGEMTGEQKGWEELTGQKPEEYQGFGWAKAVHPEDAQATVDAWNEAVIERKPFEFEHRVKTVNGNYEWFSIRAIPVLNPDNSIREWVGVHTHKQL
jgi:PAS domain S-box-containing protein